MDLELEHKLEPELPLHPSYYLKGKLSPSKKIPKMMNRGFWVIEVFEQEGNVGTIVQCKILTNMIIG